MIDKINTFLPTVPANLNWLLTLSHLSPDPVTLDSSKCLRLEEKTIESAGSSERLRLTRTIAAMLVWIVSKLQG